MSEKSAKKIKKFNFIITRPRQIMFDSEFSSLFKSNVRLYISWITTFHINYRFNTIKFTFIGNQENSKIQTQNLKKFKESKMN
ncbi:hypothetical protein BpHYR1_005495 [Brachionus plicatilis]|uniref:Uncharacterized protein n=1 Tax=Brachionus plicatilis TaxID=10195 RepID=A0A3M7PBK9_BRAPC|nr:hypothetical protein BpHYR1_005495 [Brachionus plicatilis]